MNKVTKYIAWFCVIMVIVSLVFGVLSIFYGSLTSTISLFMSTLTFVINGIVLFENS